MKNRMARSMIAAAALAALAAATPSRAFEPTFRRYFSAHDLFRVFAQVFPHAAASGRVRDECRMITPDTEDILGVSKPISGAPALSTPTPAFLRWYEACLTNVIDIDVDESARQNQLDDYVPADIRQRIASSLPGTPILEVTCGHLSTAELSKMVKHRVNKMIGPEVLPDQKGFSLILTGAAMPVYDPNLALGDYLKRVSKAIALREEFLTY